MPPRKSKAPAKREEGNGQPAAVTPPGLEPFMAGGLGSDAAAVTSVEWVRAAAEVRAHVMAAHEWPRDEEVCEARLRRSCGHLALARRAFYSYERGGKLISGPTIGLMREAMRCWGNMGAGMWELRRSAGGSEQMAWAVDWETNGRFAQTFWTPHLREKGTGALILDETEARDIYEVNTSAAAKRLREQIKNALPPWFVALAEAECERTLNETVGGEAKPFPQRLATALRLYKEMGVPEAALVRKLDAPRSAWGRIELQTLLVTYQGLLSGELRKERVFDLGAAEGAEGVLDAAAKAQAARTGDGEQESKPEPGGNPGPAAPSGPEPGAQGEAGQQEGADAEAREVALRGLTDYFQAHRWGGTSKPITAVRLGMVLVALRGAGLPDPDPGLGALDDLTTEQAAAAWQWLTDWTSGLAADTDVHVAIAHAVQAMVDGEEEQ